MPKGAARRDDNNAVAIIVQNTAGTLPLYPTGVNLTNATPIHVALVDGSGTQITTFGSPSVNYAVIVASGAGVTNLVAAVGGKSIVVLNYVLISNGAVNVKFQSHVTPTDLTGLLYLVANTGASSGYSPIGHFATTTGEALDINLSGAVAVGGHLSYTLL